MADTSETEECALTVAGYLNSEQDKSLQGEFANIMSYLSILKRTAKNLARKFHRCSFCEKNEFTWLTAKGRSGNVDSLIPVCVCKAEVERDIRRPEAHEDEDSIDIEIQDNHDDPLEETEEAEPPGTTSEINTEITEQQEKLNKLQEAFNLVHTGVRDSTAARRTGVSANELKSYVKQVDSKRSKRKQQEQVKCSWTEEDLDEALRLIREEKMSAPQAAKKKGIPYTTLWHKLQDRKTGGILRYKCSYCPLVYRRKYVRNMHEKVKHKNEYPYLCTHCGKGFTYEKRMEQHIKTHHLMITNPPKMKKCPKCDQQFPLLKDLNTHLREHSDMPYICSQCGDGFQTPKEYSEHSVAVHRAHFKNQCALCEKKYNYKHLLAEHIKKVHTGERPFPCPQCPLRFPSVRLKNAHVKRSHGAPEERYKPCSYCGKMMANQALEKHIRSIHQGLKLYTCHHCNTKFNCLQNLNRHIRTHTGEKPYICTQCGKTFAQSNACKQHYNTHHPGLEYKAKRIDKPEKIPTALLEDVAVNSEVIDATSPFQEADLTTLLNIQHALDTGTDLLSS